jgi:hypothetical protein
VKTLIPKLWTLEDCSDRKLNKNSFFSGFADSSNTHGKVRRKTSLYIYKNKDGNPSTKSKRHVDANLDT